MIISEIFKKIEKDQWFYFKIFSVALCTIGFLATFLFNLINSTILWILFPIIYFILLLFINHSRYALGLIGVSFGGYYIGLAAAGNLSLELHVVYTLLLLGLSALVITQFTIHKIVIESLKEMDYQRKMLYYLIIMISFCCISGGMVHATVNPLLPPEGGLVFAVLFVIINSSIIGYLTKRFWASFVMNLVLMLFFTIPLVGLTRAFTLEEFFWSEISLYANVVQLLFVVAIILGGLFGFIGKYKQYTKPPITITTPIDAAYVYRDRLSLMMLLGKNAFPEYETKGDKVVFYNRMDVKMGFRPRHEIRLDIIDDDKCDVYLEKFAEREKLGTFKTPNGLREKFEPKWNLLGYALKGQLVKLLRPILLIISGIAVAYFLINLIFTMVDLPAITLPIIIAMISAAVTVILLILFYIYISKQMSSVLKDRPEFSITYLGLFFSIFLAAWFISYLIQGVLITVSYGSVEKFSTILYSNLIYLMIITAIVGLSSIQVLGVQNFNTYFYHRDLSVFKHSEDEPVWLDDKAYWVFRYAYEFPGEFTVSSSQIFHEDIERMDVWVNANTGIAEWLVGDYHWREIWTRISKSKRLLIGVNFSVNFHTPVYYILDKKEYEKYLEINSIKQLFSYFWKRLKRYFKQFLSIIAFWTQKVYRHVDDELVVIEDPPKKAKSDWTVDYFTDVPPIFRRASADYLANIPWNFLRYPYGVENVQNEKLLYRELDVNPPHWPEKVPPEPGEGWPSIESENICPKCGYTILRGSWKCSMCKTDVREYSAYTLKAPSGLKKVKSWFRNFFVRSEEEKMERKRLARIQKDEKLEKLRRKAELEKKKFELLDEEDDDEN